MRASHIARLFLVAVGLPAAVLAADEWVLRSIAQQDRSAPAIGMIYGLFVAQIGLLGFVMGRLVDRWLLRWVVLVWGLVLVDTMLFRLVLEKPGWGGWHYYLPYALLSGQLGLVAIWGTFGPVRWPWRLPGFFVAALLMISFGFALRGRNHEWVLLAIIQGVATLGLCVLLWFLGFRLRLPEGPGAPGGGQAGNQVFQFSIGHMLLWMAALVPVLLLAQGLDLWFLRHVFLRDWLGIVWIALGLGVVSLIALWAALGGRPAAIRIGTLALVPALVGAFLKLTILPLPSRGTPFKAQLVEIGWGWVAWTLLAAWFLAGLLLMFRAAGYRFVWSGSGSRTRPAAEAVSSG